jgi:hypothetical protein
MNICILEVNKPNAIGRIYAESDFDKAIEAVKSGRALVQFDDDCDGGNISLNKTVGVFDNLYFEDNKLYGNFRILEVPYSKVIKQVTKIIKLYITAVGLSNGVSDDGTVKDYKFTAWNIANSTVGSNFECATPIVIEEE